MKYEETPSLSNQPPIVGDLPEEALRSYIRHGRCKGTVEKLGDPPSGTADLLHPECRCVVQGKFICVVELSEMLDSGMHFGDYFFAGSPEHSRGK